MLIALVQAAVEKSGYWLQSQSGLGSLLSSERFYPNFLYSSILITLTLETHKKTLWNSTCHILLPTKSDFKRAFFFFLTLHHYFSPLNLLPLSILYIYSFILSSVFLHQCELHKGRTFWVFPYTAVFLPTGTVLGTQQMLNK